MAGSLAVHVFLLCFVPYMIATVAAEPMLLIADCQDIITYGITSKATLSRVTQISRSIAIDYDYRNSDIYWTDINLDMINTTKLGSTRTAGQTSIVVDDFVEHPDGLAYDWIHGNLYWTDTGRDKIDVMNLQSGDRTILFDTGLSEPRALVLDPRNGQGYMYWTDWGTSPKIEKAGLDGSSRQTLISTDIVWPNGLTLDYATNKLFWIDGNLKTIRTSNLDGSSVAQLSLGTAPGHPFAITVYGNNLYWSDWSTDGIHAVSKSGGSVTTLLTGRNCPMEVRAYDLSRQPSATDRCAVNNGGCSDLCLPAPGSGATCHCDEYSSLMADEKTCESGGPADNMLLVADCTEMLTIDLDTLTQTTVVHGISRAVAADYGYASNDIFWTDVSSDMINTTKLSGNTHARDTDIVVTDGVSVPDGVAYDWTHNLLYWTDTGTNKIEVISMTTRIRTVLFDTGLVEPRALVVDPRSGWMYWTDWGSSAKIEKSGMDGYNRVTIVTANLAWPNGLTLDYSTNQLYWIDGSRKTISTSDVNGNNIRVLSLSTAPSHPFAITVLKDKLYWSDWNSDGIHSVNKAGGTVTTIASNLNCPMEVRAYDRSRQPTATNRCGTNNGGCSQLCLPSANAGRRCITGDGPRNVSTTTTTTTARPPSDGKLLVADCTEILRVDLPSGSTTTEVYGIDRAVALDYNFRGNKVFWSDVTQDMINTTSLGFNIHAGLTQVVVHQSLSVPDGLAYDWVHNLLYWTDTGTNKIEIVDLANGNRHVLFNTGLAEPRALVLDPRNGQGWMYWTDWGSNAKIEKSGMDGLNRQTIVSANLVWPNGLTLDYATNKLYWIDGSRKTITSSDLNGNNMAVLPLSSTLSHPFAITVLDNNLYWTDWGTRALHSANKYSGGTVSTIASSLNCPMEVRACDLDRQPSATNRCGRNNGGCSHICAANAAGGRTCLGGFTTPYPPPSSTATESSTMTASTGYPWDADCRNPCADRPCAHGGRCTIMEDGDFECDCTDEYDGPYCQVKLLVDGLEGHCDDGVRASYVDSKDYKDGKCKNQEGFYRYYCPGLCDGEQVCQAEYGKDELIPMAKKNGDPCESFINPVIKDCTCVDSVPDVDSGSCKLVKNKNKAKKLKLNVLNNQCKNVATYTSYGCEGTCPDGKKCAATYEQIAVEFQCDNKAQTRFWSEVPSAVRCDCCQ